MQKPKVLDCGFGSGDLLNELSKNSFDCHGIDISHKRVELAQKRYPHIKFNSGVMNDLQYQDNEFDIIICTQTIEHLFDDELKSFFKESNLFISYYLRFLNYLKLCLRKSYEKLFKV